MSGLAMLRRCSLVAAVALLLFGCGGHQNGTGSGTGSGSDSTVPITGDPATEGATTEAAQPGGGGGTAISIPSLPIGGNAEGDGAEQCAEVNWLGPKPIPPDVTISLTGLGLDPEGIFQFGGNACAGDKPECTTAWRWQSNTADIECLVPATQIVDVESQKSVTLVLAGSVHCTEQSSCAEFAQLGGSQIQYTAQPGAVSTSPDGPASGAGRSS